MTTAAQTRFAELRSKARSGIWTEALGTALATFAGFAVLSFAIDRTLRLEWPFRLVLLLGIVFVLARIVRRRLLTPLGVELGDDEMALAVERHAPDMRQALISAIQFERVLGSGAALVESPAMMGAVVDDVRSRLSAIPFLAALDQQRVRRFLGLLLAGAAVFVGWGAFNLPGLRLWALRNLALSSVEWPRYTQFHFLSDTGNSVRMPQGDSLTVRVQVEGPVPDQCFVDFRSKSGEKAVEPMSSTGEREFTWTLPAVLEDAVLRVEGGDGLSEEMRVQVVERPRIDDLSAVLVFPDYMEKKPEPVPATEGEIKLPRGGSLQLKGRSHKPIDDAFLLFAGDKRLPLQRDADGHSFSGSLKPEESGLLVVDVIDKDRLGAGQPPKWLLRIADDRPPGLDFKLRGIGQLIAFQARIPGDLKVKDDFGLRSVAAGMRAALEQAATAKSDGKPDGKPDGAQDPKPADAPFEAIEVLYGSDLQNGSLRYETTASLDLKQWSPDANEASANNRVRPGMLLSMRFSAKDNFGPGAPHESYSEVVTFRVVTKEKLLEELRRRQVEQRTELQHVLEEEKAAHIEVKETLNPTAASDKAPLAKARLKALSRAQQALGRRAAFIGESYQKILLEYENNRLLEPSKVREIEGLITKPLNALGKDDFPATARLVDTFANAGDEKVRTDADAGYTKIEQKLAAILLVMEQAETLAALMEELRVVIKTEDGAIHDVERRLEEATKRLFGDPNKKPDPDKKDEKPKVPK